MELEFPGFVALLLLAVGLLAFGPRPPAAGDRPDRVAAVTAPLCAPTGPDEASHVFGAPAQPVACTVY